MLKKQLIILGVIIGFFIPVSEALAEVCQIMRETYNRSTGEKDLAKREKMLKKVLNMQCENEQQEKKIQACAHNNLGDMYETQGHDDLAIYEYRQAIALDPFLHYPYQNLGNVFKRKNKPKEAKKYFDLAFTNEHFKTSQDISEHLETTKGIANDTRLGTPPLYSSTPPLYFGFDSSGLTIYAIRQLKSLTQALRPIQHTKKTILITGHTCNVGSENYNKGLSIKRAKTVNDWLIDKGFSNHRLSYTGKGMNEPMKPNINEENRRYNRRVVIRLND